MNINRHSKPMKLEGCSIITYSLSVPVSSGRTVIKFHANQPDLLSFNMDQPVKIFSKGAGRDRELWGVEVSHRCLLVG